MYGLSCCLSRGAEGTLTAGPQAEDSDDAGPQGGSSDDGEEGGLEDAAEGVLQQVGCPLCAVGDARTEEPGASLSAGARRSTASSGRAAHGAPCSPTDSACLAAGEIEIEI
jgi:hypothetical protein